MSTPFLPDSGPETRAEHTAKSASRMDASASFRNHPGAQRATPPESGGDLAVTEPAR